MQTSVLNGFADAWRTNLELDPLDVSEDEGQDLGKRWDYGKDARCLLFSVKADQASAQNAALPCSVACEAKTRMCR
jgi:hypothetical protein